MIINPMDAKSRFLERAAQLYTLVSPVTAAQLMMRRASQVPTNDSSRGNNPSGCCQRCSAILIPGLTSEATIISPVPSARMPTRKASNHSPMNGRSAHKWVKIKCTVCHHYMKTGLGLSKVVSQQREAAASFEKEDPRANSMHAKPPKLTNNHGSKQRAKARRRGGLQALLEKSKQAQRTENGIGLDLMDLMKQG